MEKNDFAVDIPAWLKRKERKLIVAGPCSAESESQLLQTAKAIKEHTQVSVFRAGIWKPRTKPGSFEGVGEAGLHWLNQVQKQYGFQVITEIASPTHLKLCLKYGIDMVWLGARTVANPFSVQQIADALTGCQIPVFVKNPMHADIHLWIGAIERLRKAGIEQIVAVHRGFHHFNTANFRNDPMWEIPIELMRAMPGLPIVCDPSHICGKRTWIKEISQKALDFGMHGLMIEVHNNPKEALSDKNQQITPLELKKNLNSLTIKKKKGDEVFQNLLDKLRKDIDDKDAEIIRLISERMTKVAEIGQYKKENQITIFQLERWKHILKDRLALAEENKLSKEFIKQLLNIVHLESIRIQEEIVK